MSNVSDCKEYFIKNYRKKGELLINGYNFH